MRMGVRVYYTDLERDYPEVYRDPTLLGAYVQLLALTDKAYPNDAVLPRDLRTSLVDRLVRAGLVERLASYRYAVKGYRLERGARQAHAEIAATGRWKDARSNAPGNAPSNARPLPNGDAPSNAPRYASRARAQPRPTPTPTTYVDESHVTLSVGSYEPTLRRTKLHGPSSIGEVMRTAGQNPPTTTKETNE